MDFQAKGRDKDFVGCTFTGPGVHSLFDNAWHKIVLSVRERVVSIHIDCSYISSKPFEPRGAVSSEGYTFIGLDVVTGSPIHVSLKINVTYIYFYERFTYIFVA